MRRATSLDVLPRTIMDNFRYRCLGDVEEFRQIAKTGTSGKAPAHLTYLLICELGTIMFLGPFYPALIAAPFVFASGHVLQIVQMVICLVSVFVVDMMLLCWPRTYKCRNDKPVYEHGSLFCLTSGSKHVLHVPGWHYKWLQHCSWLSHRSAIRGQAQALYSSERTDSVEGFKPNNRSPFFFIHSFKQYYVALFLSIGMCSFTFPSNRITTWINGQTLTSSALNAEFNNVYIGTISRTAGYWGSDNDIYLAFGTTQQDTLRYSTVQTQPSMQLGVSVADGGMFLVISNARTATNYALAARTNPSVIIHDASVTAAKYLEFQHDGTNSVINSGSGSIAFQLNGTQKAILDSADFNIASGSAYQIAGSNVLNAAGLTTPTPTSGTLLRGNGTNWIATVYTTPATAGTSGKIWISDGTNIVSSTPTYPNSASTTGAYIRADGTNWITSTLILPNSATATYIPYATSTNTWGESSSLTFGPSSLYSGLAVYTSVTNTQTNATVDLITVEHLKSSGGSSSGYGSAILFQAANSAGTSIQQGRLSTVWTTTTAGSELSDFVVSLQNVPASGYALVEKFRVTSAGVVNTVSGGSYQINSTSVLNATTLGSGVTASSLTSVGTLTSLTLGGDLALAANNITMTGSLGATGARLTKGWFTDLQVTNAIVGGVTGNAATATALQNARTIGGTSFDGTANIAVALAATATVLANARTIGGVSFNGSANITVASATGGFTVSGGSLVTTDIAPAANITLTQNSVVPFTSVNSGAVVNTLYLTGGTVGIGTAAPSSTLHVVSANVLANSTGNLFVQTSDAKAIDVGGQISLGGKYDNSGNVRQFATIAGRKEDGADSASGAVAGYLALCTTGSGTCTERMRISSTGVVTMVNLAGTGSRAVLADANGVLSAPVSDARLKVNFQAMSESADVLGLLDAVSGGYFEWDRKAVMKLGRADPGAQREIGFLKQSVAKVLPELTGENRDGSGYVRYEMFTPVLWEIAREQQKLIASLTARIDALALKLASK